jgi:hypothetical protein
MLGAGGRQSRVSTESKVRKDANTGFIINTCHRIGDVKTALAEVGLSEERRAQLASRTGS